MSWDHMVWQLELDRLTAESNEHADAVCRILASHEHNALSTALARHQQWEAVQTEINKLWEAAKTRGGNG